MNHPSNDQGIKFPKSLVEQMAEARERQAEEQATELPASRQRTSPNAEENLGERVLAPKPQGIAADRYIVGRPPGSALNPVQGGQGLDKFGRPVRDPNVADLREHMPGGDAA
jgi:septal ring factor EnvC (AmiA/AmiB activator)